MTAYDDQNVFAKILRGELPCEKLYEDDDTFVIMDIMPRGDGHCLVLPKAPARNILDIEAESLAAVARTTQVMARAVKKAFEADGVTIQRKSGVLPICQPMASSSNGRAAYYLSVS